MKEDVLQKGDVADVPAGPQQNAPCDRHKVPHSPYEQLVCRCRRVANGCFVC